MRGSAVNSSKVKGPGSHRMGWLGWAGLGWAGWAGLQRADLRSADFSHALRPRPSGLWGRSQRGAWGVAPQYSELKGDFLFRTVRVRLRSRRCAR